MWLFTKYGFFSITAAPGRKGVIQIRTRDRKHLEKLIRRFHLRVGIECKVGTDYQYRIYVSTSDAVFIVSELTREITWSNFKNEAAKGPDHRYTTQLHKIWAEMADSYGTKVFGKRGSSLIVERSKVCW